MNFKKIFLLFAIAIALAVFEIQIEGSRGWAENLPCWRAAPNSWQQLIYGLLMSGKPCDGFHLSELVLLILMFHLPFAWGTKWNLSEECKLLAYFFATTVVWDFLWFVLNPAYGWSKFHAEHIWWHKHWMWIFPTDYYGGFVLVSLMATVGSWLGGHFKIALKAIAIDIGALIGLTATFTIVAEIIRHLCS